VCVIAAFVADVGAALVAQALLTIGWLGFSAICLIHVVVIAGMGLAWRAVGLLWLLHLRAASSVVLPLIISLIVTGLAALAFLVCATPRVRHF